jgi:hypothetical protein
MKTCKKTNCETVVGQLLVEREKNTYRPMKSVDKTTAGGLNQNKAVHEFKLEKHRN